MIRLKYFFLILAIFFCGCSDAATKEKVPDLACPYVLPAEKDVPVGWEILGKIPADKLQLKSAGMIYGNATTEKNRLTGAVERVFAEEIIDEWEQVNGHYQAETEYPEIHDENSLKCTYGRSEFDSLDEKRNVVLLIPIPPKKSASCVFIKRKAEPSLEARCEVK